jgi:hypothetical protein
MIENDLSLEFQAPTLAVTSNGNLDHWHDHDAVAGGPGNESESDPSPSQTNLFTLLDVNVAFDRSQCQHLNANVFLFDVATLYENQPRLEPETCSCLTIDGRKCSTLACINQRNNIACNLYTCGHDCANQVLITYRI